MSPRWTTRLEARIGPRGLRLSLRSRLPWRSTRPLWRRDFPGLPTRESAAVALRAALAEARVDFVRLKRAWPSQVAIEIDDAWVQHACLRGEFQAMGSKATADAARNFFAQALGVPGGELSLCAMPQPDGHSMWVSCLPALLCQGLMDVARAAGLQVHALSPVAQRYLCAPQRWPADGVLAMVHGAGVLLVCRRQGSWVAMANEMRPFDDAVRQRALALARFHGAPAGDGKCWAAVPRHQRLDEGWRHAHRVLGGKP